MSKVVFNKESIGKLVMPKLQEWLPTVDLPNIRGGDEFNLTIDVKSEDGFILSVVDIKIRLFAEPMKRKTIKVDKNVLVSASKRFSDLPEVLKAENQPQPKLVAKSKPGETSVTYTITDEDNKENTQ